MVAVDIKNYTGYTIELEDSDEGCRIMSYKKYKEGYEIKITERKDKDGYKKWVVQLYNDEGIQKGLSVARLIMQHFKPDEWDEKLQTDHIDINSLNNRIDNLQMLTNQQNCSKKSSKPNRDNKSSGHKNIYYHNYNKKWTFEKKINGLRYRKYFKLLDEAVEFKQFFLIIHNCK